MHTNLHNLTIKTKWIIGGIILLLLPLFTQGQSTVQIGSSNSTSLLPGLIQRKYSWCAMIYKESEMQNHYGKVTTLSFKAISTGASAKNNQKIYLAIVPDSSFNNAYYIDPVAMGATLVFNGTIPIQQAGWNPINLTGSPFYYTGGNLLIIWESRNTLSGWNGSVHYAASTSPQSKMVKASANDNQFPYILGSYSSKRPNIKITTNLSSLPTTDLKTEAHLLPQNPSATNSAMTIKIRIKNVGLTTQTNYTVKYSINGGPFVSENINHSLNFRDTYDYSFSTKANMSSPGYYKCKLVVSCPNDAWHANDTLETGLWVGSPLSGSYTIGSSAGNDFHSLTQAWDALKHLGVSGSINLYLGNNIYTEQVFLKGPINGVSANNTITIKGNGINSEFRRVQHKKAKNFAAFYLKNVKHIILDSVYINLTSPGGEYFAGILIDSVESIQIKNCTIKNNGQLSQAPYGILLAGEVFRNGFSGSGSAYYDNTIVNYVTIKDIHIAGSNIAIRAQGSGPYGYYYNNPLKNITIKNCEITDFTSTGISTVCTKNIKIIDNYVETTPKSQNATGIYSAYNKLGGTIRNNKILITPTDSTALNIWGLETKYLSGSSNNHFLIANNMVNIISDTCVSRGFTDYNSNYIDIVFNTVNVNSSRYQSYAFSGNMSYTGSAYHIWLENNVFTNFGNGIAMELGYLYQPSYTLKVDYNNLYTNGSNLVSYNNNLKSDLAAWKAATSGFAIHSKSVDPGYASQTDLHASSILMNNGGTPGFGITHDIDGVLRSTTAPDMGANEYTPPYNQVRIIDYLGARDEACGLGTMEPIKVVIQNLGINTQTYIPIKYVIDSGTIISETYTGYLTSLSIDTFEFNTKANLTGPAFYHIRVYTDLAQDQYRNDDTVSFTLKSVTAIDSFPAEEDFEGSGMTFELESNSQSDATISTLAAKTGNYGLLLTGNTNQDYNQYYLLSNRFTLNPSHLASAYNCMVDATNLSRLILTFDMKINTLSNATSLLRVMINDSIYAKDLNGDSIWSGPSAYKRLEFNLNAYAGTIFSLRMESSCRLSKQNSILSFGDEVYIDNIRLFEPAAQDVGIYSLIAPIDKMCGYVNDTATIGLINYGWDVVDTIPVKLEVYSPNGILYVYSDTITQTMHHNDTCIFTFSAPVNMQMSGLYLIQAYTQLPGDSIYTSNDSVFEIIDIEDPAKLPYIQDFEPGGSTPNFSGNALITNQSVTSYVLRQFLPKTSANKDITFNDKIGPVTSNSYFVFSFRSSYNYVLAPFEGDTMMVQISTDCKQTWDTLFIVDSTNYSSYYTLQPYVVSMAPYAGMDVYFRFVSNRDNNSSTNNTYYYFDNLGIIEPASTNLGGDTTICGNDSIVLDAGSFPGSISYLWTSGTDTLGTSRKININKAGTYVVQLNYFGFITYDTIVAISSPYPNINIPDSVGLCNFNPITVDAGYNPTYSYLWNTGDTTSSITIDTSMIMNNNGYGHFSVQVETADACVKKKNFVAVANPLPFVYLGADTSMCVNHTLILDAGKGNSYLWSTGDTTKTIVIHGKTLGTGVHDFSVMVSYLGCGAGDTISIGVDPCTGIEENNASMKLRIYPNPTQGSFTINMLDVNSSSYTYQVYDVLGAVIQSGELQTIANTDVNYKFDLNLQSKGVYYIHLYNKNYFKIIKLIVQ